MSWSFCLSPKELDFPVRKRSIRKKNSPWKSFTLVPHHEEIEETEISKAESQDLRIDLTEVGEENIIPISKSDIEHHHVRLLIQQPDAENSEDDIRKDCYDWIEHSQEIHMEGQLVNGKIKVIETMLAPKDLLINGKRIRKGAWTTTLLVKDDALLEGFRRGVFTVAGRNIQEI